MDFESTVASKVTKKSENVSTWNRMQQFTTDTNVDKMSKMHVSKISWKYVDAKCQHQKGQESCRKWLKNGQKSPEVNETETTDMAKGGKK